MKKLGAFDNRQWSNCFRRSKPEQANFRRSSDAAGKPVAATVGDDHGGGVALETAAAILEAKIAEPDRAKHDLATVGMPTEHEIGALGDIEEMRVMREQDADVSLLARGEEGTHGFRA